MDFNLYANFAINLMETYEGNMLKNENCLPSLPQNQKKRRSPKTTSSAKWRTIGTTTKYFRSKWEYNYACFLEYQKKNGFIEDWKHEPQTFWFEGIKRGTVSYLPDFKVTLSNDSHYWVEVKGFYDRKSLTKIKRFHKYFPEERLQLVDATWFAHANKVFASIIPGWEK